MRKILFRGKTEEGEWVEGYYGQFHNRPIVDKPNSHQIFEPKENATLFGSAIGGLWHIIIPETLGEYIGLKDKNVKKIFESDIVKFKRVNALGYTTLRVGEVRYYDELPIFYIYANTGDAWDWVDCEEIEVIGNIHDNPELMEVNNEQ